MLVNEKNAQNEKKVGRGRPPGVKLARSFQLQVDDGFLEMVDDWRRQQPDIPQRTEAVRRMVREAWEALRRGK